MQNIDDPLNPLRELAMIISSRIQESCLLVKDIDDGDNRSTGDELVEDLMLDQVDSRFFLEFIESGLKEGFQLRRGIDRHAVGGVSIR